MRAFNSLLGVRLLSSSIHYYRGSGVMIKTQVDKLREQSRLNLLAFLIREKATSLYYLLSIMVKEKEMKSTARALLLDIEKVMQAEKMKFGREWQELLEKLES